MERAIFDWTFSWWAVLSFNVGFQNFVIREFFRALWTGQLWVGSVFLFGMSSQVVFSFVLGVTIDAGVPDLYLVDCCVLDASAFMHEPLITMRAFVLLSLRAESSHPHRFFRHLSTDGFSDLFYRAHCGCLRGGSCDWFWYWSTGGL